MVFLVIFKKNQQKTKNHEQSPGMQRINKRIDQLQLVGRQQIKLEEQKEENVEITQELRLTRYSVYQLGQVKKNTCV